MGIFSAKSLLLPCLLLNSCSVPSGAEREAPPRSALISLLESEAEAAGVSAWVPRLAAQVEAESSWRPQARSPFASGLAQFTGPTWSDIAPATDPGCADAAPVDPACSLRAQILYMRRLLSRFRRTREPWRFAWAAYNCGPGWVIREQRECAATPDCDPNRWSAHVQTICLRNPANCAETRGYPAKIESKIPRYL